jgi:hypothetical protein
VRPARSDEGLLTVPAGVAQAMKLPVRGVDAGAAADSDWPTIAAREIPVVDVHSPTQEMSKALRSPHDKPGAVVLEQYRDTYRLLAGFLSLLHPLQAAAKGR